MAPQFDISIPTTTISSTAKPYTLYNITIRLPLRSYTIQKRYSDFLTLHTSLTQTTNHTPPVQPPPKSFWTRTISSPELTETRRSALETYLQTLNDTTTDSQWRDTPVWRAFLNLPSSYASQTSSRASTLHSTLNGASGFGAPITDPTTWLDCHRDLKTQLHDARLNLTNRDQASTPQKQHEASAAAKSALVKAGGMIGALEEGLNTLQKNSKQSSRSSAWSAGAESGTSQRLGEGELRRRKDLLTAAKRDKEGLENLLDAMIQKSQLDSKVAQASEADRNALMSASSASKSRPARGRVLGKETDETRQLDNQGVLQLQKQKMQDQDLDVDELRKIVQRQRELGVAINRELEEQNEMLKIVDEDVDRLEGKIGVAKKRIGKIS